MALQRVTVATDFSGEAGDALRRAAMLAGTLRAEIELLHVVSKPSLDAVRQWVREPADCADRLVDDARRLLETSAAAAGAAVAARLAVGDVVEEILSRCAPGGVLVVGARGLNPLRDAILGTTAERLIGRSACPVLVVRRAPQGEYRSVLAAADLLQGSQQVLALAAAVAPEARMSAVHAFEVPFEGALQRAGVELREIEQHRAAAFQKALAALREASAAAAGDAARFLPIAERGHPAKLILEHANAAGADLLVIGKRRRPALEAMVLGSTTRHVLADAPCDVLVAPLEG
jgi:nucleotide-binding universal stress UspA family protein